VLNFSAAWVAFLAFALSAKVRRKQSTPCSGTADACCSGSLLSSSPPSEDLGYFQRFIESVCFTVGLNYGLGFVSELFIFVSVAAASLLCVKRRAASLMRAAC